MNDFNPAAAADIDHRGAGRKTAPGAAARRGNGRAIFLQWVRKTHGWFGLWGATLGLLFGISGIWLNHRAVLKLPPVAQQRSNTQIALPDPAPADAQALAVWLQSALKLDSPATVVRVEPPRPVPWAERPPGSRQGESGERGPRSGDSGGSGEPGRRGEGGERGERHARGEAGARPAAGEPPAGRTGEDAGAVVGGRGGASSPVLMQPEHWTINFGGPQATLQAETWAGNRSVSIRQVDSGVLGTLMNLHKGIGMPVAWILLVDTLAGSLILLSVSGLILWVMTHRRRAVGYAIFGLGCALTVGLAVSRM